MWRNSACSFAISFQSEKFDHATFKQLLVSGRVLEAI